VKVGDRSENTSSHPERIEGAHRTMAERRTLAAYLNRIPAPLLVFLGGGIGAFCRIHTPGGVLAANLIGSFTLGLLTALWASHAAACGSSARAEGDTTMRSVSGVLNRTALAGCGLLIAAASSWVLASGLSAGRSWPDAAPYLATAQDRVGSLIAAQERNGEDHGTRVSLAARL